MIRGEATATLKDGRTLTLAMGFRALALAAAETKIPVDDLFNILNNDDGRGLLVSMAVIRSALSRHHGFITDVDLDELMLVDRFVLQNALNAAIQGMSSPDVEPSGDDAGNGQAGTSTPSKKAGAKRG